MPKKTRDVIVASSDWTVPAADGVHRRTIVKGAAWTVPVVAVSVATPAAAASKSPTLAFTQAKYTGTACKTITGVQVKRTTDGTTPDAGKTVTVTLKDGYTFADGKTTYSGTTDANGLITLPDIKVPSKGGDSNFGATSNTLSATAPVSSTATALTGIYKSGSTSPIANSSTAIKSISYASSGAYYFQNSDGSIRDSGGSIVKGTESGVNTDSNLTSLNSDSLWYKKSDGIYKYNYSTGKTTGPITDSKTAIKIISDGGAGSLYFQNSDGSIRDSSGSIIAGTSTGVDTGANLVASNSDSLWYKKSDGVYKYNYKTGVTTGPIADSKDATKLIADASSGAFYFQSSDGSIRDGSGTLISGTSKDVSTDAQLTSLNSDSLWYKKSDGVYKYNYKTGVTTGPIKDSKTAIALISDGGAGAFNFQNSDGSIRDSGGDIIDGTAKDVDTGANLAAQNSANVWYKKSPACA
ncbi:hypothetical protein [Rathayibacter rathayi]|uniref:hypothetical protein n=1 Tax=Rathayibacter rathayi TaxID=33887 RepID=UPI0011B0B060|nr:hypothetical protein [Rathayibacter rathayi]